jgi:hypothetical protein
MKKPFRWLVVGLVLLFAFGCGSNGDGETSSDQALIDDGRQVVRDIVAGKFLELSERFDEGLKAALTADQLEKGWKDFVELKGAFRSQGEADIGELGDLRVVDIELTMTKEPGLLRVSFDPDGKIAGIYVLDEDIPIS